MDDRLEKLVALIDEAPGMPTRGLCAREALRFWSQRFVRPYNPPEDDELADECCPVRPFTPADAVKHALIVRIFGIEPVPHFFTSEPVDVWPAVTQMVIDKISELEIDLQENMSNRQRIVDELNVEIAERVAVYDAGVERSCGSPLD